MLNVTKIGVLLITFGSTLDFATNNIMLSMGDLFGEMNSLYYMLGSLMFNALFILMTIAILALTIAYDYKYSTKNYWLTCIGSLTIASIYGGLHLCLGLRNISIFLSVMGNG
jgi:hypothetical protein